MKLRHPFLIRTAARVGALTLRLWLRTLRYRYIHLGPPLDPARTTRRYLYAFWHENLLLPAYQFGTPEVRVLISTHADGQLIAEIAGRLGFGLVRGSTTRGGVEALRDMLREQATHLAFTPDGPRGPRRQIHPGLAYLAAKTGLPVVPVGVGYDRPWRAKSWDRFAVPLPFRRAAVVTADPLPPPPESDRAALAEFGARIEAELHRVSDLAEREAAG